MRKSIIAAAILAGATSFAFAQTTTPTTGTVNNGAASMTGSVAAGDTHDSMGNMAAPSTTKSAKHTKAKAKRATTTSPTEPGSVTGVTGTTAAGTPGQTTSGATRPADAGMSH
jgi:hypothetical protein